MEISLDRVMDETLSQPGVYGCVFSDSHGLGLGGRYLIFRNKFIPINIAEFLAKGQASVDSSGVVAAIAMLAAKLEPQNDNPIITFENDNRTCIIKRNDNLIGAIFKTTDRV